MIKKGIIYWAFILGLGISTLYSQQADVEVDDQGIMRWSDTQQEIHGFGVNYTVPFAHAYRSAEKLGVDQKAAMENDIYHFARLGFDAYRVHVWDTEISDSLGNLIQNEHLDHFDYLLSRMKKRGIRFLITPIAFWGNGWPEPDSPTPGFSNKYGKDACLTNEDAIQAQENYLYQFLNHVNPYTELAYKDDPSIIAFEVSNEPHHRQPSDSVRRYVHKLISAMKKTGTKKPVFYNISHGVNHVDAYFDGGAQGGTFQWYPTGLGAGEELKGNFLPNVDSYEIPFAQNPKFQQAAKVVYEFDAADVGRSYIYPAMARSFRTAGIQWATHFAYDPTYLAYANTEYNTHYMNLAYTPRKALSLKITGEVFHQIPLYEDYGTYPQNTSFEGFRVSYEEDLAELNIETKFFHTNHTVSQPVNNSNLEEIAGYGNSPVVQYDGQGAYFLDKIENGVWRLEVMPDAQIVKDPYGQNSLQRKLTVIDWNTRTMTIELSDLGTEFSIQPINAGNEWKPQVMEKSFDIRPGTYLLVRTGIDHQYSGKESWKNIRLNEYFAPSPSLEQTYVLHEPASKINKGQSHLVTAMVVSKEQPKKVKLLTYNGWKPVVYEMVKSHGYSYSAELPAEVIQEGFLNYHILVEEETGVTTYPEGVAAEPSGWDFDGKPYAVQVLSDSTPIYLYNALTDNDEVSRPWEPKSGLVPLAEPGKGELQLVMDELFHVDPENPQADAVYNYAMRYNFKDKLKGRMADLQQVKYLVMTGRSLQEEAATVQVSLITKDGMTYGGNMRLDKRGGECRLAISELKPTKMVTLPRPYPSFLPYFFEPSEVAPFDLSAIETLQISVGPGLSDKQKKSAHALAIESVHLE